MVMPLLSKDLKRLVQERGRMSPQQLWWLAVRLLGAAEHCHKHGVVHRDIKVCACAGAPPRPALHFSLLEAAPSIVSAYTLCLRRPIATTVASHRTRGGRPRAQADNVMVRVPKEGRDLDFVLTDFGEALDCANFHRFEVCPS